MRFNVLITVPGIYNEHPVRIDYYWVDQKMLPQKFRSVWLEAV